MSEAFKQLERAGGKGTAYLAYIGRPNRYSAGVVSAAHKVQAATLARKQFLYQASERLRVAEELVVSAWNSPDVPPPGGAILFNERIDDDLDDAIVLSDDDGGEADDQLYGATRLFENIRSSTGLDGRLPFGKDAVALEHSGLSEDLRRKALDGLRNGTISVLCTVKALQEGINVPDVGMGVSVASTSSARQRIQTMGRILRPKRGPSGARVDPAGAPVKQLHLLYVRGTVDEEIYRKTDWNDATGVDRNQWHVWGYKANEPLAGEPLVPKQVPEAEAWRRVADLPMPQPLAGPRGVRLTLKGGRITPLANPAAEVTNATGVHAMLEHAKSRGAVSDARGGFEVTPLLNVVVKRGPSPQNPAEEVSWAVGRLLEAPQWPGKEDLVGSPVSDTEAPAGASSESLDRAVAEEAKSLVDEYEAEIRESGVGGEWWYVLWQRACLAAIDDDAADLLALGQMLASRKPFVALAARYLARIEATVEPSATLAEDTIEATVPYAAEAFAHRRPDLIVSCLAAFRGADRNNKRKAVQRSLEILAGRSRSIYKPT